MPAVFVSPRIRERQLREALQEALQQQDSEALRQLSDRLVHRHGPVQLQRWMQALASEPQQLFWHQALAQPPKPEPQLQPSSVTLEDPSLEEPPVQEELLPVEQTITAEESASPVEEMLEEQPPAPAPAPIKTALQGWLPQWDGPQTDRLAS